jgi:hypothetical protein
VRVSIASPLMQPSPNGRRVGIRIVTFEACSSFTHVTAHRIAQSPKATFVTRLQPCRLPSRAARQLPDQSTILRVESSSTDDSRLRGARRVEDGRGNLGHSATPRFPSPLIEPDVPISGIRLSDWFSSHGTQRCVEWSAFEAQEPAFPIDHITGEAFGPAPCHFVPSGEEIAHALIDVSVNTTEC